MKWAFDDEPMDDGDLPPFMQQPAKPAAPIAGSLKRPTMAGLRAIGPRRWLYGRDLIIGHTSVVGAPGGTGKSALALAMAVSIASGKPLLALDQNRVRVTEKVYKRGPVVYFGTEDPGSETERRLFGLLLEYGLDLDRDGIDFRHLSARDVKLKVAKRVGQSLVTGDLTEIIDVLNDIGAALFVVDPLVHCHEAIENSNDEMGVVMAAFNEIAEKADCAVLLVHHTRKGNAQADASDGDEFRGAGAIQGASRAMIGLKAMTIDEAGELGIPKDDRRRFIKSLNAKSNMAPRPSEATWYELVSSSLGNATPEYPDGDTVQVVRRWNPRSAVLIDQDAVDAMLSAIEVGLGDDVFYAGGQQAGSRWVGKPIMEACEGIPEPRVKAIIEVWRETGVLVDGECKPPQATRRNKVSCVHVGKQGTAALDVLVDAGITSRYA